MSPAPSKIADAERSLSQTVEIETPELVVLSYTIAGLGSRVYAALVDLMICVGSLIVLSIGGAMLVVRTGIGAGVVRTATTSEAWAVAIIVLLQFAVIWGYYVLFEGLADGQTPGKRMHRLRVVRDGGYSVGFAASAVRNLMRIVDMQPILTYLIGIVGIASTRSGKRLGDVVAGTIVVREDLVRSPTSPRKRRAESAHAESRLSATLADTEFRLLERWLERRDDLDPEQRRALTDRIAERLAHSLPDDGTPVSARLVRLFENESEARRRGLSARAETGAGRERYAIVATHSPKWAAFASKLADAQRGGLRSLGEQGVREFVADYRSLSGDLARLRTATRGAPADEMFYLGRLVSAAHNLIYRDRKNDLLDIVRFFAFDVPREIRRSFAPISLATLVLFGPMAIAYTAVIRHPESAATFIPVAMQQRAEEGIRRAANEEGYIPDPEVFRPVMAGQIIANNVQVTFTAFAFGVTLGIGTTMILLLNGVSIGGILGLYVSKGIGALIFAFVAPHGVLELAAICIAGGAGYLIGGAVLLPGNRTRRQALAENSSRAMRLIAGSTLLLIAAGAIEGLISPIPYWPLSLKLSVSALTAVLLYLYLRSGAGYAAPQASAQAPLTGVPSL